MPRVRAADQIARLIEGLASSGFTLLNDPRLADRPVTLALASADGQVDLRVFCWNVTSGGRGRAADEYRVQTTRPNDVPLYVPGPVNLVLGYESGRDLFVAWEARKHDRPGASSSLQVPLDLLDEAAREGMAARARAIGGGMVTEVVTAFAPDLVGHYLSAHPDLNVMGGSEAEATAAAMSGEAVPVEELPADAERRRMISRVARLARDARFRAGVLRAYEGHCAFCDLGAGLAQAAHVRGVADGGSDRIVNGFLACPTHHRAFDLGMVIIRPDLSIALNERVLDLMGVSREQRELLRGGMRERLRPPADARFMPSEESLEWHRDRFS
jgi:putative restriction endonuclease